MNDQENQTVYVIGGGTKVRVRPHLKLLADGSGRTAKELLKYIRLFFPNHRHELILTQVADPVSNIQSPKDLEGVIDQLVGQSSTKVIFMNAAVVDFEGHLDGDPSERLRTSDDVGNPIEHTMTLEPVPKVLQKVRRQPGSLGIRKDIFLVSFKQTSGLSEQEQYLAGLRLLKQSSSNLVLANDEVSGVNMVITPEEASYHVTTSRADALSGLVEMAALRSQLHFTPSTLHEGDPIDWNSPMVPSSLREVVNYCIERGAYKEVNGVTVGHFATQPRPPYWQPPSKPQRRQPSIPERKEKKKKNLILTSIRGSNFNEIDKTGLVLIESHEDGNIDAYGAKPSVGGRSQQNIFRDHPEYDCIVHFHCEKRTNSLVPSVSQRPYECGSHECGENTSKGLQKFGNLAAVFLDHHGPNLAFHHSIDPQEVITFIEDNFDLDVKTGGYAVA